MLAKRIIPCLDVKTAAWSRESIFVNLTDAGDLELRRGSDKAGADEADLSGYHCVVGRAAHHARYCPCRG